MSLRRMLRCLTVWMRQNAADSGASPAQETVQERAAQEAEQERWYGRYRDLFARQRQVKARMRAMEARQEIRRRRIARRMSDQVVGDDDAGDREPD